MRSSSPFYTVDVSLQREGKEVMLVGLFLDLLFFSLRRNINHCEGARYLKLQSAMAVDKLGVSPKHS